MEISKNNLLYGLYFFLGLGCANNIAVAGAAETKEQAERDKAAKDEADAKIKAAGDRREKKEQEDKDAVASAQKDADANAQKVHDAELAKLLASGAKPPAMNGQGGQMAQAGQDTMGQNGV